MANIKISELNELTEKENDDYLAIVDTSASETKKISVEKLTASGVQLIAVTDTAPEEYETGDKYYNTTDNKIYTATSNDWANPQTPIENIFYIILETQNIYTYDDENETLVSVGGGAGGGDSAPIGQVSMYAGSTAPNGFLMCDGSAVSRTTYSDLYNVIGTTYGTGDGSTTFNLPNIKGRVVVMIDSNDTDFDTLGETGGSKTDSLSNAYTKMVDDGNGKLYFNVSGGKNWTSTNYLSVSGSTSASQNSTYGINLGGSVSKVQPYIVLNYIIKVQKLAGEVLSEQLPVGTEVDFDGSASDIPIGWEQINDEVTTVFTGSTAAGSASQINTTWEAIGKFKFMVIELYVSSVNTRSCAIIPYHMFTTGNNINTNKRLTNVNGFAYINSLRALALIPANDITTNTIKFGSYGDDATIVRIDVIY